MMLWILRITAAVFLLWFLYPTIKGFKNFGNIFGILMCLYILLFYTNTPLFNIVKSAFFESNTGYFLWKLFSMLIYIFISYAAVVTALMIIAAKIKPKKNSSAVVLGIRTSKNGPGKLLLGRIYAAKKYLDNSSENTVAVLTGGKVGKDYEEEAKAMYEYLIKIGADNSRLFVEDKARNTYENIIFSVDVIEKIDAEKNLAVITDGFHQLRARLIARQLGLCCHIGAVNAKTDFLYLPTYYVREWAALPFEVLFRSRQHL